jgi:phosphatidylethanolamine/phosphatidyl-N-methylethanolamine N-methyltransferase
MTSEAAIFFTAWLRRPLGIAALLPSGATVADACARLVDLSRPGAVLELGAGTGSLTRGLLRAGCPTDRIIAVECDPELLRVLKARLPAVRAVAGDATRLGDILDRHRVGPLAAILSSLPIKWFPLDAQRTIVEQGLTRLGSDGRFLQITNAFASPLPRRALSIEGCQLARVWRNAIPVQIWSYWR